MHSETGKNGKPKTSEEPELFGAPPGFVAHQAQADWVTNNSLTADQEAVNGSNKGLMKDRSLFACMDTSGASDGEKLPSSEREMTHLTTNGHYLCPMDERLPNNLLDGGHGSLQPSLLSNDLSSSDALWFGGTGNVSSRHQCGMSTEVRGKGCCNSVLLSTDRLGSNLSTGSTTDPISAADKFLMADANDSLQPFQSAPLHYPLICSSYQQIGLQRGQLDSRQPCNTTEQENSLVKQMFAGLKNQLTYNGKTLPTNLTMLFDDLPRDISTLTNKDGMSNNELKFVDRTEFNSEHLYLQGPIMNYPSHISPLNKSDFANLSAPAASDSWLATQSYPCLPAQHSSYDSNNIKYGITAITGGGMLQSNRVADQLALAGPSVKDATHMMLPPAISDGLPEIRASTGSTDVLLQQYGVFADKSSHQSYLKSCAMKNRSAANQLYQRYAQLGRQIDYCTNQVHESLRNRRNILVDKLNTVYQMKLNSLDMQLHGMRSLDTALARGQVSVESVQRKLELYSIPSDDDAITLNLEDDMWKIQSCIDRFGQISTNACASLSFICKDSLFCTNHPRTASCAPLPLSCALVKKPFRVEVQTKNYLGILMTRGGDIVQASVIQTNGQTYTANVIDCKNGRYFITTMFLSAGQYLMTVSVNGKMIRDAPLQIFAHSTTPCQNSGKMVDANVYCSPSVPNASLNEYRMSCWPPTLFPRRRCKFTIQFVPSANCSQSSMDRSVLEMTARPPTYLSKSKSSDGSTITSSSMFCRPWGICVDSADNVYIADRSNNHIKVLNVNGNRILILGCQGCGQSEFDRPSGLTFDRLLKRLIICDKDNHRIQVFQCNPETVKKMCSSGSDDLKINGTREEESVLCRQRQEPGFPFILLSWKPVNVFGGLGSYVGEFHYPWDCATNSRSEILVTDTRNHRIQMFTSNGIFIRKFGFDGLLWKRFDSPRGITVTSDDKIIVTDFNNHKIVILEPGLVNERFIGSEGEEPGKLKRPQGVCLDLQGNILVSDSRNYRIQAFSPNGAFRYQFGSFGEGSGDEMDRPAGICVGRDGTIFVVDFGNNRILGF